MSKKTTSARSFTKIMEYLEAYDNDIQTIVENLVLEYLFALKGKQGVTFLLPQDPAYRKELIELASSDNADDVDKASKMLSSCVITDILKTPSDMMEKRDDIPNALGQKIEIESVSGRDIITKSGARLRVEERFRDGSRNGKLAVWLIVSGTIPIDGPKASQKYIKKKTVGGKDVVEETQPDVLNSGLRGQIAENIANTYVVDMCNRMSTPQSQSTPARDVYLDTVLSMVGFMMKNDYCKELLVGKIIPLISYDKADFYLIFEPYKEVGPFLISDRLLQDWAAQKKAPHFGEVVKYIDSVLSAKQELSKALIYSNPQGALNEINEKRTNVLNSRVGPQHLPSIIQKAYTELFSSGIFPDPLLTYYNSPSHKMYEDEFRYVTHQLFSKLEHTPGFDRRFFNNILDRIYEYTSGPELKPLLLREVKQSLPPTEKVAEIKTFINSTNFFTIPLSEANLAKYPHDTVLYKPSPHDPAIFNTTEAARRRMRYLFTAAAKVPKTPAVVETKTTTKDDDFKAMLRKLKKEGKLDETLKNLDN